VSAVQLYTSHGSSASYRLRIALELKGLARQDVFVNLLQGAQHDASYKESNPNARVPFLVDGDARMGQALAAIEYLEEVYPEPPLLPRDAAGRARVRDLSLVIVADTQPLQNLGPMRFLSGELGLGDEAMRRWYRHWVTRGLDAFEAMLAGHASTGLYCHGDHVTLADVCVVPQLVNWMRKGSGTLDSWPTLAAIFERCQALPAFQRADPLAQPDAPKSA
jgi:maleylacetoacetate isomerase